MAAQPQPVAKFPVKEEPELFLIDVRTWRLICRSSDKKRLGVVLSTLLLRRDGLPGDFRFLSEAPEAFSAPITLVAKELFDAGEEFRSENIRLSPRQHQVINLVQEGLSNKEIGSKLNLAERTIKFHVSVLLSKYGVSSRQKLCNVSRGEKRLKEG